MEKFEEEKQNQYSKDVWDCGSTLYDSHELISFKRQLDSAIANSPRALSMPHLPERRVTTTTVTSVSLQLQPQPHDPQPSSCMFNRSFKISRTFQKLLRFVFKSGNKSRVSSSCNNRSNSFRSVVVEAEKYQKDRYSSNMVYDKSSSEPVLLSTIPEHPDSEIGGISPDISNFVRKSSSERFTATALGISFVTGMSNKFFAASALMAESLAIRDAVTFASSLLLQDVIIESDCLIAIDACNGKIVRKEIQHIVDDIQSLNRNFTSIIFNWVNRDANSAADLVAKLGASNCLPLNWIFNLPPSIRLIVDSEAP